MYVNVNLSYLPLFTSSVLQASRGTVKASADFSASADAEVLYKAMKGLGKMLVGAVNMCWYHSSNRPVTVWGKFLFKAAVLFKTVCQGGAELAQTAVTHKNT